MKKDNINYIYLIMKKNLKGKSDYNYTINLIKSILFLFKDNTISIIIYGNTQVFKNNTKYVFR